MLFGLIVAWLTFLALVGLVLSVPSVVRDGDTLTVHNVTRTHIVAVGDVTAVEHPDTTRAPLSRVLRFAALRCSDGQRVPMMAVRSGPILGSPLGEELAGDLGVPYRVRSSS